MTTGKTKRGGTIGLTLVAVGLVLTISYTLYTEYQRAKQIRTYADLQIISKTIQRERAHSSELLDLRRIVQSVRGGVDAWGNVFLVDQESGPGQAEQRYLVVSVDADGTLDVEDISAYFTTPSRSVAWEFDRDLVFRNGVAVQEASK